MKFSAAILTGGLGSRMNGVNKPELIIGNKSIISRQIEIIKQIFDEILICGKTSESFNNLPVYPDIYQGIGPVSGIYSALKYSKNPYLFILSGDMPFIDKNLITEMINFTKSNQEKKNMRL
jgi:molybdopterin-guanine dinucleotide biosynthesis protein A